MLYYEREAVGDDLLFGEEGPLVFLDVFPLFGVHLGGKGIHVVEDVDQFIELILLEFLEGSRISEHFLDVPHLAVQDLVLLILTVLRFGQQFEHFRVCSLEMLHVMCIVFFPDDNGLDGPQLLVLNTEDML